MTDHRGIARLHHLSATLSRRRTRRWALGSRVAAVAAGSRLGGKAGHVQEELDETPGTECDYTFYYDESSKFCVKFCCGGAGSCSVHCSDRS